MTKPGFEAFKLAFQDPESRVRLNSDVEEKYYSQLKSLKITGGYLDGLCIEFSEHLNAVIGGRGTGKSTLLECLRYVLGKTPIGKNAQKQHERMLTGGFYAEISLSYDAAIAQESKGRPFGIESLREIQLSKRDVLDTLAEARKAFSTAEWKCFLLRSIGLEPKHLSERQCNALLLRMVPFVERNYNLVELGPRGTGKSHLFQQVSPYAHLISGGKATVARMFVNNASGQRGLVCQYDVVCFDEVSGVSFDQKDGVNIMPPLCPHFWGKTRALQGTCDELFY